MLFMHVLFYLSSPFLFVFGDDLVTCHTGANIIPSDDGEAKSRSEVPENKSVTS